MYKRILYDLFKNMLLFKHETTTTSRLYLTNQTSRPFTRGSDALYYCLADFEDFFILVYIQRNTKVFSFRRRQIWAYLLRLVGSGRSHIFGLVFT